MRTAAAPAKLNLTLHITGKRADGYHLLESLVAFTELADTLAVQSATALSLSVDGPFARAAGAVGDNLVMKAARALQEISGIRDGAALHLHKSIPVGAGLGGGSSDAAAALRLLNAFWGLAWREEDLHGLAVTLGADVAMCLRGEPVIARGIGELLSPATIAPMHAVLVYPQVMLATIDVYRSYAHDASRTHPPADDLVNGRNDLQPAAIRLAPEVAEVLLALETVAPHPLVARMSGSGACCFALFEQHADASRHAGEIRRAHPHWWVEVTRLRVQPVHSR